jgi:hypothetical protein
MRVKANSVYIYHPNLLDRCDARTDLKSGDAVRVVNLHGCPKANTMGHCHVTDPLTGRFIGLVCCNSLHTKGEYITYLRARVALGEQEWNRAHGLATEQEAHGGLSELGVR